MNTLSPRAELGDAESALRSPNNEPLTPNTKHRTPKPRVLRQALPLLRPHWRRGAELAGWMGIDLVFALAIPLSAAWLFDDIIARRDSAGLGVWMAVVLAIFGLGSFAAYRRLVVAGLVGELILRDLRRRGFAHLQRLSLRFHSRARAGDVLARLMNDMEDVQAVVGHHLPELFFQVVSLLVAAGVLLALNWMLGLPVLLLGMPAFAVVYHRATHRLEAASRDYQDGIGDATAAVHENLAGQREVKAFALESHAISGFERHLERLFQGSMRLVRIEAVLTGSASILFLGIRVLTLGVGALLVLQGLMSVGVLVAFIGLTAQALAPVMALSGLYQRLQAASGAFDRVREVMEEAPDVAEAPDAVPLPRLRHEIRLERVTLRHEDEQEALSGVSLCIPAGRRVAIVGPSGAGKSSLVALLLRLCDPTAGRVLFDGRDVRAATLATLRGQVALVPQESFLFGTSIRENIALGRAGATEAMVERAARAAALDPARMRMEAGYETEVGERGARLSGGERQRVTIARALVREPALLILDEATAALDPDTESAVLRTVETGSDRTTILVTHRLATAASCELIFVLDAGRLVEEGTHPQLMRAGGLYRRLYDEQSRDLPALSAHHEPGDEIGVGGRARTGTPV